MRVAVELTRNFESNLDATKAFLDKASESAAFDPLIDHLFDVLIPNLQSFPHMGRDFLRQPIISMAARTKLRKLKAAMGKHTQLREYISDDYLILYALRASKIYLLSIRHHRQLSFELKSHWT
jgi:plasmid stabilization system protein ParE